MYNAVGISLAKFRNFYGINYVLNLVENYIYVSIMVYMMRMVEWFIFLFVI